MQAQTSGRLVSAAVGSTLVGVAVWAILFVRSAAGQAPPVAVDPNAPRVPVLVELFTSEGCSSCPPAEDVLVRLDREQPVPGVEIIPVGFHVDYWDDLGWADPFSSPAWSDRQRDYDRGTGRVYTPQAVVQGGGECVGSDDSALRGLARQAAAAHTPRLAVTMSAGSTPGTLHVRVAAPAGAVRDQVEVSVVLVERGIVVDVQRGENRGRHLAHAPVARDLVTAGVLTAAGGALDATLPVPAGVHRENLRVVAVAQQRGGRVVALGSGAVQ
jgi:hypothetical protein